MPDRSSDNVTLRRYFLHPANAAHRQYEALRAFLVEGLPSAVAARRFGYSPGSFRVLMHHFRRDPARPFFLPDRPPGRARAAQRVQQVVALRKKNLSIDDISRLLEQEGHTLSAAAVANILREEGFARLPRRRDEERPLAQRPRQASVADVRQLDLSPRKVHTQFGGLFLFLPDLLGCDLERILRQCRFPGTDMVPAGCALRALLGLKLLGASRHSHVMSDVEDEGLALFAGLNAIPKRSFLAEYSSRLPPSAHPRLMAAWLNAIRRQGLQHGDSFDLDFHSIPFHGEDPILERHYISRRSRRQKGILAFLAQEAQSRVFCYANADLRKSEQNDEILRFVEFWKKRTGRDPAELIFDSKLTTYANLNQLNRRGIDFITLRRRSEKLLRQIALTPPSAWRRIELENVARQYRTPRILDELIELPGYEGPLRQLTVRDLGHEEPTLLLTNQLRRSPVRLVGRYAQRMLIENNIADGVGFFHMDALSSAVAVKVDLDLQLTLMASGLYRLLAQRIGRGHERARSDHLFRDFVRTSADVVIGPEEIEVRLTKRAHNPLLLAAGFHKTDLPVPWLDGRRLRLTLG